MVTIKTHTNLPRRAVSVLVAVCALALSLSPTARADFQLTSVFGEGATVERHHPEGISQPGGIAVNETTGDVYVAEKSEARVTRFDAQGDFLEAWGWGVGSRTESLDQNQQFTVRATAGTYTLGFNGETTAPIAFDAPAGGREGPGSVEAALQALPSVGGAGGKAEVVVQSRGGSPGESIVTTYFVTFGGSLGGIATDPLLTADGSGLTGGFHRVEGIAPIAGFQRCGPAGEASHPHCDGEAGGGRGIATQGAGGFNDASALAIDQATGDVYVVSGKKLGGVEVFTPTGEFITSFGESGEATPEQIGAAEGIQDIAVDSTGDVYLLDSGQAFGPRVMVFEPASPGEYAHYVYAGRSHDLFVGQEIRYSTIARDSLGDFYFYNETEMEKFAAGDLSTPAWHVTVAQGNGFAVDTNAIFYWGYKKNIFHRLNPANGEQLEEFPGQPGNGILEPGGTGEPIGLALNPTLSLEAGRPAGVLYVSDGFEDKSNPHGLIFAQPAVFPPRVDSEWGQDVGSTSASLKASVSSGGYDTHYRFQYGSEDCATHECAEAPVGGVGADLGAGKEDLTANAVLSGLQPETTYHYRVVASNAYGTAVGPDQTFTTYPTTLQGLPDDRAYELVSPPSKNGGEVFSPDPGIGSCELCKPGETNSLMPMQSAPNGDSVVYEGFPFAATGDAIDENQYLATRTAQGWQTTPLSPSDEPGAYTYQAFATSLSPGILTWGAQIAPLSPEVPEGYENLYRREANGTFRPLVTEPSPDRPSGLSGLGLQFSGASPDFSHIVFAANIALTGATSAAPAAAEPVPGGHDLYEWIGGHLRLVSALPGNATSASNAALGAPQNGYEAADVANAVSADGSRIFWTDVQSHPTEDRFYVRQNGETTLAIPGEGAFAAASVDGSKVLLSSGELYSVGASEVSALVDLTGGHGGFQGILGASEDLARVYFVDSEALTGSEQNARGAQAQAGRDNAYVYDAAAGGVRYIATLLPSDNSKEGDSLAGAWRASPEDRLAQVTPDGRYLAFVSEAPLTGYDNEVTSGHCDQSTQVGARACAEVFEYDAVSGRLACASCNPAGIAPLGPSLLSLYNPVIAKYGPRQNLASNGRVFFDSQDVLSPFDANGRVEDVYEYEPAGIGTCARPAGCVALISSGHSVGDSNFVAASADGGDVFFTTREGLVPIDKDPLVDLYDARVNGGFPELTPPACTGTGCQGVPNAPPIFATPSSVTFAGVGNFTVAPTKAKPGKRKAPACRRATRRLHRRCAKTRPRRAKPIHSHAPNHGKRRKK